MPRCIALLFAAFSSLLSAHPVFNVKDYGAAGIRSDNARPALQQAIDACGKAGGGTVYVGPGEYTTGQLHLRSGVRLYVEAGATLFASFAGPQFDPSPKSALISGEDLHDIALGRPRHAGRAIHVLNGISTALPITTSCPTNALWSRPVSR